MSSTEPPITKTTVSTSNSRIVYDCLEPISYNSLDLLGGVIHWRYFDSSTPMNRIER